MSNYLTIDQNCYASRRLRKKIKKWVKRGWAELEHIDSDVALYKMNTFYCITEDKKLKVDYDKLFRIKAILGERIPRHTVAGE